MNNQELAALCRIEIRRWQSAPDKQYMVALMEAALAALTAEPKEDERAQFESFMEWRFGDTLDRRRAKNGGREYMEWSMAVAWEVWQRRALPDYLSQPATGTIDNTAQQYEALAGWKMVPVEPTQQMRSQIHPIADGNCSHCGNRTTLDCEGNMLLSWRDMLEAAPKPEGEHG